PPRPAAAPVRHAAPAAAAQARRRPGPLGQPVVAVVLVVMISAGASLAFTR
ncbi:hypothetical protein GQ466_27770, partial [Actinomadura rayongensis]|nr:hypothetical protein [Actinomadura rayongensis]